MTTQNLCEFIQTWEDAYFRQISEVQLFQIEISSNLSLETKQKFALLFYHIRGHFDRFLWLVASLSESFEQKRSILENMSEEFGAEKKEQKSHELLYYDFCQQLDVDILSEVRDENNNICFIREFNRGHQRFLVETCAIGRWAAFLAYERLDNLDYSLLLRLVDIWKIRKNGKIFFLTHSQVKHFEKASYDLEELWQKDPQRVLNGFNFIAEHQIQMWNKLSQALGL